MTEVLGKAVVLQVVGLTLETAQQTYYKHSRGLLEVCRVIDVAVTPGD
jgi:hypothetical protein